MKGFIKAVATVFALVFCCWSNAKDQDSKQPQALSLEQKKMSPEVKSRKTELSADEKSAFQTKVEFPSTGEMFEALDKLAKGTDWNSVIPDSKGIHYSSKTLQALNLGTRVADGFAAVRAKDVGKLEHIAQHIETLSHDLGIPGALLNKKQSILDDAHKGQWTHVRQTLDGLQTGVLKQVDLIGQNDTATLAVLGGWIEAMRIATKALSQSYNADASQVLYQPAVVTQLITRYNSLGADVKKVPAVALIGAKLQRMQTLCNVGIGKPVDQKSVTELLTISSNLASSITKEA